MAGERKRNLNLFDGVEKTKINGGRVLNPCTGRPYSAKYFEILERRRTLPVWQQKIEFLNVLAKNQTMILVGGIGCGKSTQIPQFVVEAGYTSNRKQVACTQSRGLAATSVSRRVADEMDVTIGDEVGYRVEVEDCSGPKTTLKYLTDSMLMQEAMTDPLLERYGVIILDEAQERTLATDVVFGLLKEVLKSRPDLKLVVMIATLEAEKFQAYFDGAPLLNVPGGLHPVEVLYTHEPKRNYVEAAIREVVRIHTFEPLGDILVFLAGENEIEYACKKISQKVQNLGDQVGPVKAVPLYFTLPLAMQEKIFDAAPPPVKDGGSPGRKIVVSTNTAELLTIDGIVYVVDPGIAKQNVYDPRTHTVSLLVSWISKGSAHERTGRVGRTQPGKCFRLYTPGNFQNDFQPQTDPPVLRSKLANFVLKLKKLGIDDNFKFMDPPPKETLTKALELLKTLAALDDDGNLTHLGRLMGEFPLWLEPQMSKVLVVSPDFNCSNEILSITTMLSAPACFLRPRDGQEAADAAKARFSHIDGDHLTLLNVYQAYKKNGEDATWCDDNFVNKQTFKSADYVRTWLVGIMNQLNLKMCSTDFNNRDYYVNIRKAMLAGFFMHVAHMERSGHYRIVKDNQMVHVHPSSCLDHKPEWVMYNGHVLTTENQIFFHIVTDVRGDWLIDIAPHYYNLSNFPQCEARGVLEQLYLKREKEKTEANSGKR